MRIPFSITIKLMLFIVPLVAFPTLIVGYLSYDSSIESVTFLSREQQLLQAKAVSERIDNIFRSCFMDLKLIKALLETGDGEDGSNTSLGQDETTARCNSQKMFEGFLSRSPYYRSIRLLDANGKELLRAGAQKSDGGTVGMGDFEPLDTHQIKQGISMTEVMPRRPPEDWTIFFSQPLSDDAKNPKGEIIIDFDYGRVLRLVRSVDMGGNGSAYMVDHLGRVVAHPRFRPYEYNLSKYSDPSLREFVVDMICGETVWRRYNYLGEKASACAPVPSLGWSLAVTLPIEEFKKEAKNLRKRMIEVMIVTLIVAGLSLVILSYQVLKPVKRLAVATEQIAHGDLEQKIPVNSKDELGMLTRSFNRMVENLKKMHRELLNQEKLVAMGKLSAAVAHEIRNPLNAMKGAMVYLQRKRSKDELVLEYTSIMLEEVERLNLFVTEFLAYARQAPPKRLKEDINELIRKSITLFEEKLRQKNIRVVRDFAPSMPKVPMDTNQIEQVMSNLIINALDAMPEGGTLLFSTTLVEGKESHASQSVLLTVKDTGVGIGKEELARVFDPFFSTKEDGTGLGLPISLRIVENHGGTLSIRSEKGAGTVLSLQLPVPHEKRKQSQ